LEDSGDDITDIWRRARSETCPFGAVFEGRVCVVDG
jgi:hypothetical protein